VRLNTYLNYGGNCEEAFRFYEQYLGGKITMLMRHEDAPGPNNFGPEWQKAVLYTSMSIGGTEIMANDVPPERFQPMRSVYLSLRLEGPEEAEKIHALLAEGGEIFMPLQETFFAHRFSMLRDRFGTSWMILAEKPMRPDS
jgi:PhnB protein